MAKLVELIGEFRLVFAGRQAALLDSLLPPFLFLLSSLFLPVEAAIWPALTIAAALTARRLIKKEGWQNAVAGLAVVLIAAIFAYLSDSGVGFYLPGLLSSALTILLCFVSILLGRPLVAWTSFLARRWPLEWYWHARVRPAYSETTLAWGLAFSARLALEYWFFQSGALTGLGTARLLLGWPFTVVLLVATYLYGLWRLRGLGGPSVAEFQAGSPPPWQGQQRGF